MIVSCNYAAKDQIIRNLYGKTFCLDVITTDSVNNIKIGNGTMTLNADMTLSIQNDSLKYSNIKGYWDLCCYYSDFGNYVFKMDGLVEQKHSTPYLFVRIENKEIQLFFKQCK